MFYFSIKSEEALSTCCTELQVTMKEAIKRWDFSVLCGHRNSIDQNKAFSTNKSKVKYPDSKHNIYPSEAVDIAPYPIDYNDIGSFYLLVGYIIRIAEELGYDVRSGSDWDSDRKTTDQTFHDIGHIEYIGRLDLI